MLKRDITYTDFDGNSRVDTAYFHLSKTEIGRMQVKMDGKYIDHLKMLVSGQHVEELYDIFYNLVLDSYGEKSDDGTRFIKTPEKRAEFESSIAFDTLFSELITDMNKMADFTKKVIPADMTTVTDASNPAIMPIA